MGLGAAPSRVGPARHWPPNVRKTVWVPRASRKVGRSRGRGRQVTGSAPTLEWQRSVSSAQLEPAALTSEITKAAGLKALLSLVSDAVGAFRDQLNHIHLSA